VGRLGSTDPFKAKIEEFSHLFDVKVGFVQQRNEVGLYSHIRKRAR